MSRKILVIIGLFAAAVPVTAAHSARNMYCSPAGYAYIVTVDRNGYLVFTNAGGCAGGPWTIELSLVRLPELETNWRDDIFLTTAYTMLEQIPDRRPCWTQPRSATAAPYYRLPTRATLNIGVNRLPAHVNALLSDEPPAAGKD